MEFDGVRGGVAKPRKKYTMSRVRELWTDEEHAQFKDALNQYGRDWKKIESCIKTKNIVQIRSHAQKYFIRVLRNNTGEKIPPARPKRRTAKRSAPTTPAPLDPFMREELWSSPVSVADVVSIAFHNEENSGERQRPKPQKSLMQLVLESEDPVSSEGVTQVNSLQESSTNVAAVYAAGSSCGSSITQEPHDWNNLCEQKDPASDFDSEFFLPSPAADAKAEDEAQTENSCNFPVIYSLFAEMFDSANAGSSSVSEKAAPCSAIEKEVLLMLGQNMEDNLASCTSFPVFADAGNSEDSLYLL
mmetsp:Transcript_10348/g.18658  ORF Transcript_10348/g.18658 Transcript_10348/m.18658 type:complete len:302 (-) Transcript_10348:398-1303(-)|eukprot:CAMPEP_0182442808 /NCGR_PEP_ID=MMETSP1172-20130603/1674_1 /TAXON_ID=708627 /ORGANISM="Timspurckia oligopyrenoides, Strain CCMP3278" /LENGTH=301 /DNA_ID=CAMNT_0024637851 /DNA_START=209 /DNA_END=1114 /DNA_ORIENTATION=+